MAKKKVKKKGRPGENKPEMANRNSEGKEKNTENRLQKNIGKKIYEYISGEIDRET